MPRLQKAVTGMNAAQVVDIPNVRTSSGFSIAQDLRDDLEKMCTSKGKKSTSSWPEGDDEYRIIEISLESLPQDSKKRTKVLHDTGKSWRLITM